MTANRPTDARPQRSPKPAAVLATVLVASLAAACAHGLPHPAEDPPMNARPDTTAAATEVKLLVADGQEATLQVEWNYSAQANTVLVEYRLRNGSAKRSLAVFDRGVYGDRAGVAFNPGPIGQPRVEREGDGIVLLHSPALPTPAPTVNVRAWAPLVMELGPGHELKDQFAHRFEPGDVPKRMRWCLAVMELDGDLFGNPVKTSRGTVWTEAQDTTAARKLLCTPWYEVSTGRFSEVATAAP